MYRFSILATALAVCSGFAIPQNVSADYLETFSVKTGLEADNDGDSLLDYPQWTFHQSGGGDCWASVPSATISAGDGKLFLVRTNTDEGGTFVPGQSTVRATVSANWLTGGASTAYDVSSTPLNVSAELMGSEGTGAQYHVAITIGDLEVLYHPDYNSGDGLGGIMRVGSVPGTGSFSSENIRPGFIQYNDATYRLSASISEVDQDNYGIDFTLSTLDNVSSYSDTFTVAKSVVGAIDDVGVLINGSDVDAESICVVNNFSVSPASPVPEPSTLGLALGGLVSLAAYAWRKRRP
jgi:hypothetical protein